METLPKQTKSKPKMRTQIDVQLGETIQPEAIGERPAVEEQKIEKMQITIKSKIQLTSFRDQTKLCKKTDTVQDLLEKIVKRIGQTELQKLNLVLPNTTVAIPSSTQLGTLSNSNEVELWLTEESVKGDLSIKMEGELDVHKKGKLGKKRTGYCKVNNGLMVYYKDTEKRINPKMIRLNIANITPMSGSATGFVIETNTSENNKTYEFFTSDIQSQKQWLKVLNAEKTNMRVEVTFEPREIGFKYLRNVITHITPESQAARLGLCTGWTILQINGKEQPNDGLKINEAIKKSRNQHKPISILFDKTKSTPAKKSSKRRSSKSGSAKRPTISTPRATTTTTTTTTMSSLVSPEISYNTTISSNTPDAKLVKVFLPSTFNGGTFTFRCSGEITVKDFKDRLIPKLQRVQREYDAQPLTHRSVTLRRRPDQILTADSEFLFSREHSGVLILDLLPFINLKGRKSGGSNVSSRRSSDEGADSQDSGSSDDSDHKQDFHIDTWGNVVTAEARENEIKKNNTISQNKRVSVAQKNLKQKSKKREDKWLKQMVDNFPAYREKNPEKVKKRIRKGIPESCRGKVWVHLTGANEEKEKAGKDYYESLVEKEYDYVDRVQINKDIHRTFPKHIMFIDQMGRNGLFNVLYAYAAAFREIGYCQGMAYPCGTFLMYMPEEDAFFMLKQMLSSDKYWKFGGVYEEGFPLLFEILDIHDNLLKKFNPNLFRHFIDIDIFTTAYATAWYTTIFSMLPPPLRLRIWDIFLSEGIKILFRMAIGILQTFEKELLSMDMEEALTLLKALPADKLDAETLINRSLKVPITEKKLSKLSQKYRSKKTKH